MMIARFLLASCLLCFVLAQQLTIEQAAENDMCDIFRRKRKRNKCKKMRNRLGLDDDMSVDECATLPKKERKQCRKCAALPNKKQRRQCRNQQGGGSKDGGKVCGTDGNTYKNFEELTRAQFNNPRISKSHDGPCKRGGCDRSCGKDYDPICGTDGVTYSNPCLIAVAKCKNSDIRIEHHGECDSQTDPCDRDCDHHYNPVCATNGRTFDNMCELKEHSCRHSSTRFSHHGECREFDSCNRNCGSRLDPVCGTNGRTYDNQCELMEAHCRDNFIRLEYHGACDGLNRCERDCSAHIFNPVCATDGRSYSNNCKLIEAQCRDNRIRFSHHGECRTLDHCDSNCAGHPFSPVCGTDGETYNNNCQLTIANCRDNHIILAHHGQCVQTTPQHQCGAACTRQGQRICGSDNKIYDSRCALENAKCFNPHITQVSCPVVAPTPPPPGDRCSKKCDISFSPVCGTDGVTYRNHCRLLEANCRSPSTTRLKSFGQCP